MDAWVGLGGNRDDSASLMGAAVERLAASPGLRLLRRSRLYRSAPWGVADQPDYVNAVAQFETDLPPTELLSRLLATETLLGRERHGERWAPRCIDIDLLAYGNLKMRSDGLELPHPHMHLRAFVLVPLLELEPRFVIPGIGPAADCLRTIDQAERAGVEVLRLTAWEDL